MRSLLLCGAAALALALPVAAHGQAKPAKSAPAPEAAERTIRVYLVYNERRPADEAQPDRLSIGILSLPWGDAPGIDPEDLPVDLRTRTFSTVTLLGIDIDESGRVTGCTIVGPSEDPRLDRLACERVPGQVRARPLSVGPGRPVASRLTMGIGWESFRPGLDTPTFSPLPPIAPPAPPAPGTFDRGVWPRMAWPGHVLARSLPRIQGQFPANAKKQGTVSLDLMLTSQGGIGECLVGRSSGDPALDEAACRIARTLDLAYLRPCDYCLASPVPLQLVWRRKGGSHVRLPLLPSYLSRQSARQPRDPADSRTADYYESVGYTPAIVFQPGDFDKVENRAVASRYLWAEVAVDARGRATRCALRRSSGNRDVDARICRLLMARPYRPATDVFGDPAPSRRHMGIDLRSAL